MVDPNGVRPHWSVCVSNSNLWLATASDGPGPHLVPVSYWWDGARLLTATYAQASGVPRLAPGFIYVQLAPQRMPVWKGAAEFSGRSRDDSDREVR